MRLYLSSYLLLFTIVGVLAKDYKVKVKLEEGSEIEEIYLYRNVGGFSYPSDTVEVKKGKFTILMNDDFFQGLYEIALSNDNRVPVILSEESFKITLNAQDLNDSPVFKKSPNNTFFRKYLDVNNEFATGINELEKKFALIQRQYANDQDGFNRELQVLRNKVDTLRLNRFSFFEKTEKQTSFIKEVCNMFLVSDTVSAENYLSTDLFTERMSTGDFLVYRIQTYGVEKVRLTQENVATELTKILTYAPKDSWARQVAYLSLIRLGIPVNVSLSKQFFTAFKWEYPNSPLTEYIASLFPKEAVGPGDEAPEIVMLDVDGNERKLSDLRGKVVLLDFWASWCRPCRLENPNVVRTYKEYHDKGFEVFSVSLDRNRDSWLRAIEKDGLIWENHVSELKHWDSLAARAYSVTGIPATFLIGPDGKILFKNLRGPALEQALSQIFK